jgi:ribonuclease D
MNLSPAIQTAFKAADSAILLNTAAQVSRAAKAWRRCKVLGLDTEFVRERTYFANIGLVQLSDGHTVWLVDPLVDGAIEPLRELLENTAITKIVHSPSEDYEVLMHAIGALPDPIVDTQVACALLGQPLQTGYHTAAEWLLDVPIDKDQTRSNWCARPLRQKQLRYASLDVCFLPMMWKLLKSRLQEKGRLEWFTEDCAQQVLKARQPVDLERSWQRIRGNGRLDGQSLAILQALAAWRENEARRRNQPRGFVITDTVLLNIARHKISDPRKLESIDDLHPRAVQRHGAAIVATVQKVMEKGIQLPVIEPLSSSGRKQLNAMRSMVRKKAEELGIESTVLASKKDLEALVQDKGNPWPEKINGWRMETLGQELREIMEA